MEGHKVRLRNVAPFSLPVFPTDGLHVLYLSARRNFTKTAPSFRLSSISSSVQLSMQHNEMKMNFAVVEPRYLKYANAIILIQLRRS